MPFASWKFALRSFRILLAAPLIVWLAVSLACQVSAPAPPQTPAPIPTLAQSPFELGRTVYGFFPSPPEVSLQSVFDTYAAIGQHGDVVLLQQNIPWQEMLDDPDGPSQRMTDIHNQYVLAHQNGLDAIFVVDPLNGLNRSQFYELPRGWEASFANPDVRAAFTNFTLRVLRQHHPRYLGLASEINTYADTHPQDFLNYLGLYQEVYEKVKAEAPETQVFVTFQWEELNNLIPVVAQGRPAYQINWEQVEAFEPQLDLWVISSYPFVAFGSGADIPADYYTPLLQRTLKPLAVAEGGFNSRAIGTAPGSEQDQVAYLDAIHRQIGARLDFWIYLLLSDFNLDSYAREMRRQGHGGDVDSLGMFAAVGLRAADGEPKAALAIWDSYREGR